MLLRKILEYSRRYLGLFFDGQILLGLVVFIVLVYGLGMGAILFLERDAPNGLNSISEVSWWVTLALFNITDPQYFPATFGGKLVGLGLDILSTVLLWLFSAIIVALVLDVVLKEGQGMGNTKHKNHVIICGWNETAAEIIEQLHKADPDKPVVILAKLDAKPVGHTWVSFIKGDPTDGNDLQRANVMEADVAVIFPITGDSAADAQSLLTVLAIETLNRDVYTCVEILDPKNSQHFARANVDEMFIRGELGAHLLARATLCKGLSGIVSELLRWDEGNEFYKIDFQEYYPSLLGRTFDDALDYLKRRFNLILIAIERVSEQEEVLINPSEEFSLIRNDQAILIPAQNIEATSASVALAQLLMKNGNQIPKENLCSLNDYLEKGIPLKEIAETWRKRRMALVGIRRITKKRETFVNPKDRVKLQPGDWGFVIAWDPPQRESI